VTIKDNWNREPLIPHGSIRRIMIVIYLIAVVWMLLVGYSFLVSFLVPVLPFVLVYLIARMTP